MDEQLNDFDQFTAADAVSNLQTQTNSLRENFWEKLTNLRFRFNDGDLLFAKYIAYPEVELAQDDESDDTDEDQTLSPSK
jgi:hypothetical protein